MQSYNLLYDGGLARLFVSQQNGFFVCSLLYCIKSGSWANNEEIILDFKLEHFSANSLDGAVKRAETWFTKNISNTFTKKEA